MNSCVPTITEMTVIIITFLKMTKFKMIIIKTMKMVVIYSILNNSDDDDDNCNNGNDNDQLIMTITMKIG